MTELRGKRHKLLIALLTSGSTAQAIATAGIAENTAYKYMHEPDFSAALREARRDVLNRTTSSLTASTEKDLAVLNEVMDDDEAPASSRVAAAKLVLDVAFNAVQADDLQERIEAIEQREGANRP